MPEPTTSAGDAAPPVTEDQAIRQRVKGLTSQVLRQGRVDPEAVMLATQRDKKRVGEGPVPFVLLDAPGVPRLGCVVDRGELTAAVKELAS